MRTLSLLLLIALAGCGGVKRAELAQPDGEVFMFNSGLVPAPGVNDAVDRNRIAVAHQ